MAMLVAARDQYLQEEQRHEDEHKHNMQDQVRRQVTRYPQTSESLTHAIGHDAEENHKQVPTRLMKSDQPGSCRSVAGGLGSFEHHDHVRGGQYDKGNAGHNSGNI